MIRGTCLTMCPKNEQQLRNRENVVHMLEIDDEYWRMFKKKKGDPEKMIKCYKRSSAGSSMTDPNQLRPDSVLLHTLHYLINKILTRRDVDWATVYEFTFDRMRAIRQDMVIQRLNELSVINLLEPIVKFHIYASERMCDRTLEEYVPKFNDQHLLECITQLLTVYDFYHNNHPNFHLKNRSKMEALNILIYLGDTKVLSRALSLPFHLRKSANVKEALEISLAWYKRDYVQVFRKISKLDPLSVMAALYNLKSIRRDCLEIMSSGYSTKNITFPAIKLKEILYYTDIKNVLKDCSHFGLNFTDDEIKFQKSLFKTELPLAYPERHYTDQQLDDFLPNIILPL